MRRTFLRTVCLAWSPVLLGAVLGCTDVLGVKESTRADAGRNGANDSIDARDDGAQLDSLASATRVGGSHPSDASEVSVDGSMEVADTGQHVMAPLAGQCRVGTEQMSPATDSKPAVCVICPVGSFCAGAASPKRLCAVGTWDHDGTAETECVAHATCPTGRYVVKEGSATADRVCADCESETFSAVTNAVGCSGWKSCAGGTYVPTPPTAASDRNCAACPPGSYSIGENVSVCAAWTSCEPGSYVATPPSASSDRRCAVCPVKSFSAAANAATCMTPDVVLSAGGEHTCIILVDGRVKCWGRNDVGQLGLGDQNSRGSSPNDMGERLPAVALGDGHYARAVVLGLMHTCVLLDGGQVKCWGSNGDGALGQGDTVQRGSTLNTVAEKMPAVDLGTGRFAKALAAGANTCALLDNGTVKCWGGNEAGQLGLGDKDNRGDGPGEMGDKLPIVDLGERRTAQAVAVGAYGYACVLLDTGNVKCWGRNAFGSLGLGDVNNRGAGVNEMGDSLPNVNLGSGRTATAIAAGTFHVCVLLDTGDVKCWGRNNDGQLGLGDTDDRGDGPGEMGDVLPVVKLGANRTAVSIVANGNHSCAILDNGSLKCWGKAYGQGDIGRRGDAPGEMGDFMPATELGVGRTIKALTAGQAHDCALLDDGNVKCWGGNNYWGFLGLGDSVTRGFSPGEMGDALPPVRLR